MLLNTELILSVMDVLCVPEHFAVTLGNFSDGNFIQFFILCFLRYTHPVLICRMTWILRDKEGGHRMKPRPFCWTIYVIRDSRHSGHFMVDRLHFKSASGMNKSNDRSEV